MEKEINGKGTSLITEGRTYSILGIVFAILSVIVLPIVFGPVGIIFGVIGTIKKDIKLGVTAIILSVILATASAFFGAYFLTQKSVDPVQTTIPAAVSDINQQPTTQPTQTNTSENQQSGSQVNQQTSTYHDCPTCIDANSLAAGDSVITLGANPVTWQGISFSDTITDLGQVVPKGSLSWAPLAGPDQFPPTTGHYVQVNLTLNDVGLNSEGLEMFFAGLYDQADRYYSYQMGASTCSGQGITEGTQGLNPDTPCVMNAIFQVGQDSNAYTLKLYAKKDY